MIVIVDGPDGSGKTTLSNELRSRGFQYYHCARDGVKFTSNVDFYDDFIRKLEKFKKNNANLVIDRCYFSNIVYSKAFKDSDVLTSSQREALEKLIDRVIIALPEKAFYLDWFSKVKSSRFELYDIMTDVYDLFEKILTDESFRKAENICYNNIVRYDMTQHNISDVSNFLDNVLGVF